MPFLWAVIFLHACALMFRQQIASYCPWRVGTETEGRELNREQVHHGTNTSLDAIVGLLEVNYLKVSGEREDIT